MPLFVRPTSIRKHSKHKHQILRGSKKMVSHVRVRMSKWKKWMTYVVAGVSLLVIGGVLVDQLWMRNERYIMRQITVSYSGVLVPYVQTPEQDIVTQLQGKHYYLTKSRGLLRQLRNQYSMIESLDLVPSGSGYHLTISYRAVQVPVLFAGQYYGLLDQRLYELSSWSGLLALQIPHYFSGMTLSGMFYEVPAEQLAKQYQVIINGLKDQDIQALRYHVAAKQIQVNTPKQEIYFDVSGNIYEQLKVYRNLLANQELVPNQRVIDLGALRDAVVVYP